MERFQGCPGGMNGVLKAPDDFVVVGAGGVKRRGRGSLTSALWKVLGVVEGVILGWYNRFGGVDGGGGGE